MLVLTFPLLLLFPISILCSCLYTVIGLLLLGAEDCLLSWLENRPPGRETCPLCNQHVDARKIGRPSRIVCNLLGELSRRCDFARRISDYDSSKGPSSRGSDHVGFSSCDGNVSTGDSSSGNDGGGGCPWVGSLDAHASHVKQCRYASRSVLLSRLAAQDQVVTDLRREVGRLKAELKYPSTTAAATDTGCESEHFSTPHALLHENNALRDELARLNHLLHACQGRDEMTYANQFDLRDRTENSHASRAPAPAAASVEEDETLSSLHSSATSGTVVGGSARRHRDHSASSRGRHAGSLLGDQLRHTSNIAEQHNRSGEPSPHVYTSFNSFSGSSLPRRAESKDASPLRTGAEAESSAKDACVYESLNSSSTRSQGGASRGWVAGGGGTAYSSRMPFHRISSSECRNEESSDSDGDIEVAADDDGRSSFDCDQRRHSSGDNSEQRRRRSYRRDGDSTSTAAAVVSSVSDPASEPAAADVSGMTDQRRIAAIQRAQAWHRQRLEEAQAEGRILPDFSDDDGPLSGENSLAGDGLADSSSTSMSSGSSVVGGGGVSLSRGSVRTQAESKDGDDEGEFHSPRLPSIRHSTGTDRSAAAPMTPLNRDSSRLASSPSPRFSL